MSAAELPVLDIESADGVLFVAVDPEGIAWGQGSNEAEAERDWAVAAREIYHMLLLNSGDLAASMLERLCLLEEWFGPLEQGAS